jgi:catechol 2,3-dioxygenase-like lactoylglutathione lyase family enzyme
MRLRRLQHVSSPYAAGLQAEIRHFYGEVLGLTELAVPESLHDMNLVWFSAGDGLELHFFEGPPDPGTRRHFCLDIEDLDETRRALGSAGVETEDADPIPNRPRFFCRDPVGNLVELTSIEGSADL